MACCPGERVELTQEPCTRTLTIRRPNDSRCTVTLTLDASTRSTPGQPRYLFTERNPQGEQRTQERVDNLRGESESKKATFQSRAELVNRNSNTKSGRAEHPFFRRSPAAPKKIAWAKQEHNVTNGPTRIVSSHLTGLQPSCAPMAWTNHKSAAQVNGIRTPQIYA